MTKEIEAKKTELLSAIDQPDFARLSVEFIELLRTCEFKPQYEDSKKEDLQNAQNIFGYYDQHPSADRKKEVIKEINALLHCIEPSESES